MNVSSVTYRGRKAWQLNNGAISITVMQGGGHIASLTLDDKPGQNPLWAPVWKSMEPWDYNPKKHKSTYELKLLGSILGHNVCLGWFGDPSKEEMAQGLECHGEAPTAKWKLLKKKVTASVVSMTCGCDLPISQMRLTRTITAHANSDVIQVTEKIDNLSKRDLPYTFCEHVTVGPPFLEKGVTVFDMPATKGHSFPGPFSTAQRLKSNKSFTWPVGPGAKGQKVDLRVIDKKQKKSSDFTTQLMDPKQSDAWFSAVNPKAGLMLAYVWKREDFPWVGNWEENYGRTGTPWNGKSLTRGMEFANTPFPVSLRAAVDRNKFQGEPTYRWLPAKSSASYSFDIIHCLVTPNTKGVESIQRDNGAYRVRFKD